MPNQNNFNKLVFLKKFNNYFNRKIFGGPSLKDYVFNGALENPVANFEYNVEFEKNDIFDFTNSRFYLRDNPTDIPYGLSFLNFDWNIENGGGYSFSINFSYYPETRIIELLFYTDAPSEDDIPNNFKLLLKVNFENNVFAVRKDINFNPNDEISSEIIINNLNFQPDYLLVLDNSNNIVSRWFVIESARTRLSQTKISLKRDAIYDNLDTLLEAPIFVQRGMLPDTDSFIYNNEGMSVNQVKTRQTKLVDASEGAFFVIYIARNTPETTITLGNISLKISGTRKHPRDAVYDIIVIPYETNVIDTDSTDFGTYSSAYYVATRIAEQLGTQCYDVQLLPYCPMPDLAHGGAVDLTQDNTISENNDFNYITESGIKKTVILYPEYIEFETNPLYLGSVLGGRTLTTNLTKKESSNLQLFRIVSPNYQGAFDLNIGKNNGSVQSFKAQCTYKPFTPFIRISPSFSGLYGNTYLDNRGLICGGDFSLTIINSEWVNYQLNNKNYQNIFNREIQNMDFTYSIEERNQIITGITGIAAGMGAGAAAGAMVGGPWGALAGAVVGGIASGVGMAIDTYTLEAQYKENRDLAIDKYNYQLGNIKALPYTLTKVGNFDYISAIHPFIEQYDCTSDELIAFHRKIEFESMTVMRIDTMSNFYRHFVKLCYFKGELIRNDKIATSTHVLLNIYNELLKGVYL